MSSWEKLKEKAREVGRAVGDVASDVVDSSKQKLDEMKQRRDMEDKYQELGRMYYQFLREDTAIDAEKAEELAAGIDAALEALKASEAADAEVSGIVCPYCSAKIPEDAVFCSFCGKSVKTEE